MPLNNRWTGDETFTKRVLCAPRPVLAGFFPEPLATASRRSWPLNVSIVSRSQPSIKLLERAAYARV